MVGFHRCCCEVHKGPPTRGPLPTRSLPTTRNSLFSSVQVKVVSDDTGMGPTKSVTPCDSLWGAAISNPVSAERDRSMQAHNHVEGPAWLELQEAWGLPACLLPGACLGHAFLAGAAGGLPHLVGLCPLKRQCGHRDTGKGI